ncbi:ABC transporter ATP-binding protein [Streptomyces canus]|uniref:ABC transporter ATP-binding protein n=1 Tax=Streptomyces canus TaxID=58343 RepID=UPI00382733E2
MTPTTKPAAAPEPLIEVTGLSKTYGSGSSAVDVVHDVSFTVHAGRTTALVGESGAGKSTIAAIVVGLTSATEGTVIVCGEDRSRIARRASVRRRRARQLQMVQQDPYSSLDPKQRVGAAINEIVALHEATLTAPERAARVLELLRSVGLDEQHRGLFPKALSGGQRQRVAIARALAARPSVIVLDEAVAALDVSVQAQVLNLLARLQRDTGVAYLFITHDLAVVRQLADEVLVLQAGRVVECGHMDQVLDDPKDHYTQLLVASTPHPGWTPQLRSRLELESATAVADHMRNSE